MDEDNVKLDTPVEPTPEQAPKVVTPTTTNDVQAEAASITEEAATLPPAESVIAPENDVFHLPEDKKAARKAKGIFNKRFIVLAVGILLLSAFAILMLSATRGEPVEEAAQTTAPDETEEIAIITAGVTTIEGTLETSSDAKEWDAATIKDDVANLQYVRTTDASRGALGFSDGSIVRLNESSTIQIRTLTDKSVAITVLGGETYAHLSEGESVDFKFSTSNDAFSSKDAIFRTINSEELEGIEVFDGDTTSANDATIKSGESLYVINTKNPANAEKVVELNRASLLADDFIQWNVKQDALDLTGSSSGILDDLEAPKITITSPTAVKLDTEEKAITVAGTINDKDATLTINEAAIKLDAAGAFSTSVDLKLGKNTITVTAKDAANNNSKTTLTVTRAEATTETDITLQASKGSNGINVSWDLKTGVEAPDGYKVVYGEKTKPSYKSTDVKSQQTDETITVVPKKDGKTYYIRVCIYNTSADTCANYSNEVKVTAPTAS